MDAHIKSIDYELDESRSPPVVTMILNLHIESLAVPTKVRAHSSISAARARQGAEPLVSESVTTETGILWTMPRELRRLRPEFSLRFRPSAQSSDFLVLRHRFERSL